MRPRIGHALLLHGAGGGGWEWNLWRDVLAASGIEAATPDFLPADAGLAQTTLDDYRRQAQAALHVLPRPRAVIGASLGGLVAMLCADEADALVLVNPIPPRPWSAALLPRAWPPIVPWERDARLASTRQALPDADDATALYAFKRWRDESSRVLHQAQAGVDVLAPACPVLFITSREDESVPPEATLALASAWNSDVIRADSPSHVGPLLGRGATALAAQIADWLSGR